MFFLPSDVARLVLGYLKENSLTKTYSCLLSECKHLREYYQLLKSDTELEISPSPLGVSLITILEEWGRLRQKDNILSTSGHNATEAGKQWEDRMSPHSSTCNTQGTKSNVHRRSSYSPRAQRVKVVDSFDDTAESVVDSEEDYRHGKMRPCMHGDAESTEEESDCQRRHLRRSRLRKSRSPWEYHGTTQVSSLRKRRISPRRQHDCPQGFHRRSRHEQFHNCACHMTLLQTDNPGKSGDKYPNLMNLLQVSSMCKHSVQTESSPRKNAESSTTVQHEKSLAVSEPDPSISDVRLVNCHETQLTPTSNTNTSGSVTATSSVSSTVLATGSNAGSKSGKSPSKRSQSLVQKTPSKASPIEDLNSLTKSPRRKKPKTPRKRNSVSPTNSVKELSGSEDKLPLFKQVLSDRRLHEKLAETCNIVTGQLKLSVSGGCASGEKPKVTSPPQRKAKDESQPVTASKSLEEILDLDTNYASEFLSENIDMSDPAFDCLFKLFGTDKESFSENIRKENQKAVKETEKLQRDLEELERSMNEEFGPRSNTTTTVNDKQRDGTNPVLPESTSDQADPAYSMHVGENRIPAFSSTGSQNLSRPQNQMTVHQSSEPASPYITQSVCQSPFLAGDGVSHCIAGDGVGQFTALLRGHELGSSPAHSTPSRKSTYSTGNCQYNASPASVTTQPFSPYSCSSPAGYLSPRSNVAMEIPGRPVAMETQVLYQEPPSQRHNPGDVTNERNQFSSTQPVPSNCSPPAATDLPSGNPSLPQNNGPYSPQASKPVHHPVKSTQLFLSSQLPPIKTINSGNTLLKITDKQFQDEGTVTNSGSVPNIDLCHSDKTLNVTNCDPADGEKGTDDSNSVVVGNGVTTILNFNSHQYQENPGLTTIIYRENGSSSSNSEPSTIVNTIGCISLPEPDTFQENTISNEAQPKRKRATRSDKGKSRKKTLDNGTDQLQVLRGLLSQQVKPATEEGLIESDRLTEQDFENQQLVMLSPGGSTLKIPVLDCIDEISSPSRAFDRKSRSASDSETEGSNCISITRENQATAALVDSIKSGNTNDIIKNAKDMADDNKDEKKKKCIKKPKRAGDSKVDKSKNQRKNQTSPGKPGVEPEEIFIATPLQYKYKNVHVRILDFGIQYKPILPKPSPSKTGENDVISNDKVCNSNFISPPLFGSTKTECVATATSSVSTNEKGSLSVSKNDSPSPLKLESITSGNITILTKIASPPSKDSTSTTNSIIAKTPKRRTPCSDPFRSLTNCDSSCSDSKENKSKLASLTSHGTSDLVAKDLDSVPVRRHTRSSKPATLERLNDKGIAEKVDNSEENSKKAESPTSERIIYRRKPIGGKDMRVIRKRLRAFEEGDDVYSDFSENASPQSKASDTENMLALQANKECTETQQRLGVEGNENKHTDTELQLKKGQGKEIPCDKYKNKEKLSLKESGTKVSSIKESSDKHKGESPLKKKVTHKSKCRKSLVEEIGLSESSSEDLPLSKVKNRLVESVQDAKGSGNKSKCTSSHSRNKKERSLNENDNVKKIKLKDKHTKTKENEEKFKSEETCEKTPKKSQASPQRSLQLDEITPSKESWMEHVGLTPTKDLMNAHNYTSPGRPNPLDIIAACQNATPSEKMRSRNNSPFKTPSKVRHKTPAKRLFDSVCEQNPPTQTDKECTQNKVERILQMLQDNNPDNNLVTKVTSSTTCTNKPHKDGKLNKKAAWSSKSRKEKDTGRNSKSKDICERKKSSKKKEQPKAIKEKLRDLSSEKKDTKKHDTVLSSSERRTVKEKDRDIFVDKNDSEDKICQKKSCDPGNSLQVMDTEVCTETGETVNDDPKELENDLEELNSATDFLMKEMEGVGDTSENNEIQIDISEFKAQEHVSETIFESRTEIDEGKEMNENDSSQYGSENRTAINDEHIEHINTEDGVGSKNAEDSESEAERSEKSQNSRSVNGRTSLNDRTIVHGRNIFNDIKDGVNDNCSVSEKGALDIIQRNTGNTEDSIETVTEIVHEQGKAHASIRIAEKNSEQYEDRSSGLNKQNDYTNVHINDIGGETLQDSVRNNTESMEKIHNNVTMEEMGVVRVREDNLGERGQSEVPTSTNDEGAVHHHKKHSKKKKSKKRKREESQEGDFEERHKKKRKKHGKHKEKHHKKHRKSTELSNLNIDAALSQLYTQSGTTAENPYRTPHITGRLSSPVGQIVTEQGEPTQQTAPRINSDLLRVSEHEQPLKHSTPILNSNFNKEGAFGTLFSPVTENS